MQPAAGFWGLWPWWVGAVEWPSCWNSGFPCVWLALVRVFRRLLCDPGDCGPPGSPVHGILQARILEGVAISFSRGSF